MPSYLGAARVACGREGAVVTQISQIPLLLLGAFKVGVRRYIGTLGIRED